MSAGAYGLFAHLRRISGEALRRVALWSVGAFVVSALIVALIVALAGGLSATTSTPALLAALALGVAAGWIAGLTALTLETLRLVEAVVDDGTTGRRR